MLHQDYPQCATSWISLTLVLISTNWIKFILHLTNPFKEAISNTTKAHQRKKLALQHHFSQDKVNNIPSGKTNKQTNRELLQRAWCQSRLQLRMARHKWVTTGTNKALFAAAFWSMLHVLFWPKLHFIENFFLDILSHTCVYTHTFCIHLNSWYKVAKNVQAYLGFTLDVSQKAITLIKQRWW